MDFLEELKWRGLVHQCTDLDALREKLSAGKVTLYCGFDPTATSLHVGSLVPLMTLRRFMDAGHRAIALIGGATGLVGDPSGKSAERVLQTPEQVQARASAIEAQVGWFTDGVTRNNLSWTKDLSMLEFLRDIGKHFSVNAMIRRDSVASRLEREGEGLSFTEFSYMLLQAYDFLQLNERDGCTLQIGGSDQWGNMCSGVDLIRRKSGEQAFALTLPLLTMADGQKFGKTANGAIWLDATLTSPWEFYQFWLNTEDADVVKFLKLLSWLSPRVIDELEVQTKAEPQLRAAQRALARAMTDCIHGREVSHQMGLAADVLFQKNADIRALKVDTLEMLAKSVAHVVVHQPTTLNNLLCAAGLEASKTKANQVIKQAGVAVNNRIQDDPYFTPPSSEWLHGRFLLVKKGKKAFALIERAA